MGRYLTKMMFLVLTPILVLHLLISSSSGAEVNSNENERFPLESIDFELEDLILSQVFHVKKICCSASQMQTASLADKNMATYEETPRLCASFCDRVFEVRSDSYFSSNGTKQVIVPCGENEDIICGKWESYETAFCDAVGFIVQPPYDSAEEHASLDTMMESFIETEDTEFFETVHEKVMALVTAILVNAGYIYFRWNMQAMYQEARNMI